jgi:hypothetical protein
MMTVAQLQLKLSSISATIPQECPGMTAYLYTGPGDEEMVCSTPRITTSTGGRRYLQQSAGTAAGNPAGNVLGPALSSKASIRFGRDQQQPWRGLATVGRC